MEDRAFCAGIGNLLQNFNKTGGVQQGYLMLTDARTGKELRRKLLSGKALGLDLRDGVLHRLTYNKATVSTFIDGITHEQIFEYTTKGKLKGA